jgi:hypothetical protein
MWLKQNGPSKACDLQPVTPGKLSDEFFMRRPLHILKLELFAGALEHPTIGLPFPEFCRC